MLIPDRDSYLARWSRLHGGYDPRSGLWLVRAFLTLVYRVARPLAARRVSPSAVTVAGVLLTALVVPAAAAGGRWPLLGLAALALGGVADSVDGAVAVLTNRATAWGYVLDSVADRCGDVLCLVALWCLGAPGGLLVAAGCLLGLLEYTRARAAGAGFGEIGVVTVGERPTRMILTGVGVVGAGLLPGLASVAAVIAAAGTVAVCAVGCGQLGSTVRRTLVGSPPPSVPSPGESPAIEPSPDTSAAGPAER
ncbi:CDP-alcohol phosphatidyltransferase family protein [Frankia sp. AiPa1]|uniref:CDP-alcohol phosphatidyltransferase family protein n=1 Tax=Frankia sp. AiPa1 TaxID=573492 RepID=UPI00202B8FCA|nr:CDP-alcohol phosphatidyltransferase family protein [Frankia sp. AiPa1]MCL9757984.1 CDP-alcohol phosphatidyltransferase family protein [Frankia sp. AiPa1]